MQEVEITTRRHDAEVRGGPGPRREHRRRRIKAHWIFVVPLFFFLAVAAADVPTWPPFLPPRESFPPTLTAAIEHVWLDPTLSRRVQGRTAHVPFDVYAAFIDSPDVIAAAARHLELVNWEVEVLNDDWYRGEDHNGAEGLYRVLEREPHRRVILSWGRHSGSLLGTIRGSAISVMDFTPSTEGVAQLLTAYIRIDNSVAARLAKILLPIFGWIADRKLAEGFNVTAQVAEWAVGKPTDFCAWLASSSLTEDRQQRILAVLPSCHDVREPEGQPATH